MQDNQEDFDFKYWSNLYKEDPERFEQERLTALQKIVDEAPTEECKLRLEQTMFRINYNRATAKNELHSCIKASNMMWEGFHKLNDSLQDFAKEHKDCVNTVNKIGENRKDSNVIYKDFK